MEKVQRFIDSSHCPRIRNTPKFVMRTLAVMPHLPLEMDFTSGFSLLIPPWALSEEKLKEFGEELCHHLLDWGYNTLLLGMDKRQDIPLKKTAGSLKRLVSVLHQHHIKLIVAPIGQQVAYSPDQIERLSKECEKQGIDALFLELKSLHVKPRPRDLTTLDLLEKEIGLIQTHCTTVDLFFYACFPENSDPLRFVSAVESLPAYVNPSTHVAFSPYRGSPWERQEPHHVFWNASVEAPVPWNFPLIPVVDCGGVGLGGGLWPVSTVAEFMHTMAYAQWQPLEGAIVTCSSIPKRDSPLAFNLIEAGRVLCGYPPSSYHCTDARLQLYRRLSEENARLIPKVQRCSSREEGELFLAEIAHLRQRAETLVGNQAFEYCYRDLRRFIAYGLQQRQQPIPKSYVYSEEGGSSFWAEVEGGKMPVGYVASPKIRRLKVPSKGEEGSEQRALFGESDLFIG